MKVKSASNPAYGEVCHEPIHSFNNGKHRKPPTTYQTAVTDFYFGTEVKDPYRWLESIRDVGVNKWVDEQNQYTAQMLNKSNTGSVRKRLNELLHINRHSLPVIRNHHTFYLHQSAGDNQSKLYMDDLVVFDPMQYDKQELTHITGFYPSPSGNLVVLALSSMGADWVQFRVLDTVQERLLEDTLSWIKFSPACWHGDGFFYSRFPEPDSGKEYSQLQEQQHVCYHKIGDSQDADQVIFADTLHPRHYVFIEQLEQQPYLFINVVNGTQYNRIWYIDLTGELPSAAKPLTPDGPWFSEVVGFVNQQLLIRTNYQADNFCLCSLKVPSFYPELWHTLLPERSDALLEKVVFCRGELFAVWVKEARHEIELYRSTGEFKEKLQMPWDGSVAQLSASAEAGTIFFTYSTFIHPEKIYSYDVLGEYMSVYFEPDLTVAKDDWGIRQVFYPSKDGTRVPMYLVGRGIDEFPETRKCYLYGYGGFGISMLSSYKGSWIPFIEAGGILAIPSLRGGNECGKNWHLQARGSNKHKVFEDFEAAAAYLHDQGITEPAKTVIGGRSNGGLLVGVTVTQNPGLARVALAAAGLYDMIRYQHFTVGHGWVDEYLSSDTPEGFDKLMAFSPLHNVQSGVAYPAIIITAGDHDDRVVPAHSYKFAAALQAANAGSNPILLRVAKGAGHTKGNSMQVIIDELVDVWSFIFQELGMRMPQLAEVH